MIKTFDILLSIIIPAYNAEPFLERTVNSIIKEINGSKQVEILIVDDGSTDNTASIIEKIKYWLKGGNDDGKQRNNN